MTMRNALAATFVAASVTICSLSAFADIVAVIGTGRMGAAIGPAFRGNRSYSYLRVP